MDSTSHKPFTRLRRFLHRIKISHIDDGTDDFSQHPHRKRRLAEEAERQAMRRPRTVSAEDRIIERGANPRTGMVSPFTPAVIGGKDYIRDLVPMAEKRNFAGLQKAEKRCNSDGRWRQNSSGWNMVALTPGASLTSLVEEEVRISDDGPAQPVSIQDLQDRFVVQMPGVDDPTPENATDAQIRKYQRAVMMAAKAGGSEAAVPVPEGMGSMRKTNAVDGRSPAAAQPHTIPRKLVGSGPISPANSRAHSSRGAATAAEGHTRGTFAAEQCPPKADQEASPTFGSVRKCSRPTIKRQACASSVPQLQQQSHNQEQKGPDTGDVSEQASARHQKHRLPPQARSYTTKSTSAQASPPDNHDISRPRASNHTNVTPIASKERRPLTTPTSRASAAQATLINRAKIGSQAVIDECMPYGISFAPETWFQGHWANPDPERNVTIQTLKEGDEEMVYIARHQAISDTHAQVPPSGSSITSTTFPFSPTSAVTHILGTFLRAPAALKLLGAEDNSNVQPKMYFKALQEVILAGVYLLVALRVTCLVADTVRILWGILIWGWLPAIMGFGIAKWYKIL